MIVKDIQHVNVLRQRQKMCDYFNDCNLHNCVRLTTRTENLGQKLYMDNFFSFLDLTDDLHM
jgi:hypothetical protein